MAADTKATEAAASGLDPNEQIGRGPERLEAFSDGVFAIAITLLVLEIRVPTGDQLASPDRLLHALGDLWPSYLGYVLSFVTVGIMWANHHNLFRYIARVDHGLLLANLLLLVVVGFIPFPTALLAATLGEPTDQIGLLVYSGSFTAVAIAFNVLWYQARSHGGRLLRRDADPGGNRSDLPQLSARTAWVFPLVSPDAHQSGARSCSAHRPRAAVSPAELVRRLRPLHQV